MIVDAIADPGPRWVAARTALAEQPPAERMSSPGHLAIEVLSGLRAAANHPNHPLQADDVERALHDAEALGIAIDATPWADVHRAWQLAQLDPQLRRTGRPRLYRTWAWRHRDDGAADLGS